MPRKKPVENAGTGSRNRASAQPGLSDRLIKLLISQTRDPWKYPDKSAPKTFHQIPKSKKR